MSRREFRFEEGTSRKFWAVAVNDTEVTIQFGKIGTSGQTQIKSFNSSADAQKAADKLIAEKTGKGYVEVGDSTTTPAAPAKALPAAPKASVPSAEVKPAPANAALPDRRIRLEPADWMRARWRERPAVKPPVREPKRPFDFAALKKLLPTSPSSDLDEAWAASAPPDVVTVQEARFWGYVHTQWDAHYKDRKKWIASLQPSQFDEPTPLADLIVGFEREGFAMLNLPLFRLQSCCLSASDWIELATHHPWIRCRADFAEEAADLFEANLLPRIDAKEADKIRAFLRKQLTPPGWRTVIEAGCEAEKTREARTNLRTAAVLAVPLGMHEELLAFVEAHSPELYKDYSTDDSLSTAIFGLNDPALVERHFRRLKLHFGRPKEARAWLAHTEHSALDLLRDSIFAQPHANARVAQVEVLLLAESPEAARVLLEVKVATKTSKVVAKISKWFDSHPEHAAAGLAPLATERTKLGQEAAAWLEAHQKRSAPAAAVATPTPAPAKKSAPIAAPKAPPAPERKLNLEPADWDRARGPLQARPQPGSPSAAPNPRPFDLDALKKLVLTIDSFADKIPVEAITPEEGRFWLLVGFHLGDADGDDRERRYKKITAEQCRKAVPLAHIKTIFDELHYWPESVPILRAQAAWLSLEDLIDVIVAHPVARMFSDQCAAIGEWLATSVFRHSDESAMTTVRNRLVDRMNGNDAEAAQVAMILARFAGIESELVACVEKLNKGTITPSRVSLGWASALFGLKDVDRLVTQFRRLGLRLVTPTDARTWLALTGHSGLDVLRDSILAMKKGAEQLALLDVLLLAESPEAALALLEVKLKAKPPEAATRINAWMRQHEGHALAAFTPLSVDDSPIGEAARAYLAEHSGAPGAPPSAPTGGSTEALRPLLDSVKPAKSLPSYADPAILPPLPGLDANDVSRVLSALTSSTLAGPAPLIAALRRQCDRGAVAAFGWKLFEGWLSAGAPSKEKWAFLALGPFGDDACVLKLAPLIRAWPGESQHQRAVTGLEVLRTIGTDTALTQLNGMALKLKFKGLQERAKQMMDAIATDRGMTREQLEDRIVPDLGLSEDGSRAFDFGARSFRFALSDDFTPVVADGDGKQFKDLPKPGAKDDSAKASTAVEEWKLLKKQLRETLKIQNFRLEEAMITGRSWTPEEFQTLLVRHPFMTHLVRRLVWQGRDEGGQVVGHFRVTDDQATVSNEGNAFSLANVASVRIAHRLSMLSGEVTFWRQEFDKRHLHPPFPQLDRQIYSVQPDEANTTNFARPQGGIPGTKVRGNLEGRGWRRMLHDHGGIVGFNKVFASAGVTAFILIAPAILIGMMTDDDVQIPYVYFVRGEQSIAYDPEWRHAEDNAIPLGQVDAVAYSEVLLDLLSLVPAGK